MGKTPCAYADRSVSGSRPVINGLRAGNKRRVLEECYWLLVTGYSWPAEDREAGRIRRVRFSGSVLPIGENAFAKADPAEFAIRCRRRTEKTPRVTINQ